MYYLFFILIASSLWNIIEHILLDTAEVIKVRGPHAVGSKTPNVGSLGKMSLIQHQRGQEERRRDWDCQPQIMLKMQQQALQPFKAKAAEGCIVVELQMSQTGMVTSAPKVVSKKNPNNQNPSQAWTSCSSPISVRKNLGHDFSHRKNEMLSHHIKNSNN